MTDTIFAEQLLYGWGGTGTRKGYQVIAVSSEVSPDDTKYIEQNALPVSFEPGDFETCLRKYILPTGSIAFSFVRNAGKDELGRTGAYYAHFIIVPYTSWYGGVLPVQEIMEHFITDPEEATYVFHSFTSQILSLPQIQIKVNGGKGRQDPRSFFSSSSDLAWFLFGISSDRHAIRMTLNQRNSQFESFSLVSRVLDYLPAVYLGTSITTYSNAVESESALFKVFLDGNVQSAQTDFSGRFLSFEEGRLLPLGGSKLPDEFKEIADYIWNGDNAALRSINKFFEGLPGNIDLGTRIRYSASEFSFGRTNDIDMAIYLMRQAPTAEKSKLYAERLKSLMKSEDDFKKVSEVYIWMMQNSVPGETDSILMDSISILSGSFETPSLGLHLEGAFKAYSELREKFPYMEVFRKLTLKEGQPHRGLSRFLYANKGAFKRYVSDFIRDANGYKGFSQIVKLLSEFKEDSVIRDAVISIFYKGINNYSLNDRVDFIDSYTSTGYCSPDLSADMVKEVARPVKKTEDARLKQTLQNIVGQLSRKGLNEKSQLRLRKLIESA